jgi:hypothetical protein
MAVLLGYSYSLDRIKRVAERAEVPIALLVSQSKVDEMKERLGLPTFGLPPFQQEPELAAAELNALITERKFSAFWPLSLASIPMVGVNACEIHPVTTPHNFEVINDKVVFAEEVLGDDPVRPEGVETVGAAATYAEVERRLMDGVPVVSTKPARGVNGTGYIEVSMKANLIADFDSRRVSLKAYKELLEDQEAATGPERTLVMEKLHGPELSVDALCYQGKLLKWVVREKEATAFQLFYFDHPVIDHVEKMVSQLGLHGIVSLQYMYDGNGNLKMLEINLRPSGGCVAYGEPAMESRGRTGLLTDWLRLLDGQIGVDQISQWWGRPIRINIRGTAYVVD